MSDLKKKQCESIVEAFRIRHNISKKISKLKTTINDIISMFISIRFNRLPFDADYLMSEAINAVGIVSSQIVARFKNQLIDNGIRKVLEYFLSQIMYLLLSGPQALVSFIAFPLNKAKESSIKERKYILMAQNNINDIIRILRKWLSGFGGEQYYVKMKRSLPIIVSALEDLGVLISKLENKNEQEEFNAFFDKSAYNSMRNKIKKAIEITIPVSDINNKIGFADELSRKVDDNKKNKVDRKKLDKKFNAEREVIDNKRLSRIEDIKKVGNIEKAEENNVKDYIGKGTSNWVELGDSMVDKAKLAKIDEQWKKEIEALDVRYEVAKKAFEAKNDFKTYRKFSPANAFKDNFERLGNEFNRDMINLNKLFLSFLDNTKSAYKYYKISQFATSSTYSAIDKIKGIMRYIIKLANVFGNDLSEQTVVPLLGRVEDNLLAISNNHDDEKINEEEDGLFVSQIKKYEKDEATSTGMAVSLLAGHGLLHESDGLMSAVIVDSLINLINSDDLLRQESKEFENFRNRISDIVDWDDKRGVWGVSVADAKMPPYVSIIADTTTLLAQLPILLSGNKSEKEEANEKIIKVNNKFRRVKTHNSVVYSVLSSYNPVINERASFLEDLFTSIGLQNIFYNFSVTLDITKSIKGFTDDIMATFDISSLGECVEKYPELIKDEEDEEFAGYLERKISGKKSLITTSQISVEEGMKSNEKNKFHNDGATVKVNRTSGSQEANSTTLIGDSNDDTKEINTLEEAYGETSDQTAVGEE